MGKRQEYKAVSYISIGGAPPVRFDSLSDEERTKCAHSMAQRMSATLSDYYSNHPDEAEKLLNAPYAKRA